MRRRRQPEIIAGRVNADGTIAGGDGYFTVQKTATGAYTLAFAPGFRVMAVLAHVTVAVNNVEIVPTVRPDLNNAGIGTFVAGAGTNSDQPFAFIAVGVQQ